MVTPFPGMKLKAAILCFCVIALFSFFTSESKSSQTTLFVNNETGQLIKIITASIKLVDSLEKPRYREKLQQRYLTARAHYKRIEFLLEYTAPLDVKYFINGALVKKSDVEIGNRIVEPHGFQVVEEQLFGTDHIDKKLLLSELELLNTSFKLFKKKLPEAPVTDSQLLEAMQLELIRVCSLSLNGSDATYTKTNVLETTYVLDGFKLLLESFRFKYKDNSFPDKTCEKLIIQIAQAKAYCLARKNYETFNRLHYITRHIKPMYSLLVELHSNPLFPFTPVNYAINFKNQNVFNVNSFNLNYFSINIQDTIKNSEQAKLGELLFFDPVLSGNNQRACASCHKPEMAFTDGLQQAMAFENKSNLERNTPTLLNVMFQKNFFYDGRARQLEHQASDVLHNLKEMNATIDDMIFKLKQSSEYRNLFTRSFAGTEDTTITYYGILKAISEYEKNLTSLNSRFDKYIDGDYTQLNTTEINGYTIFAGKALCGSCHFFPLFNGLVPPAYNDTEYEVIGVPLNISQKIIDTDEGRIKISKAQIHQYAFKTPTLRNITLTAPYMHNGIYKTLNEVVQFYNKGGGQGLGIEIKNQTLPFDSLSLSTKEVDNIIAFMKSLTDTTGFNKKLLRLPKFENEKFNVRTIGGNY